MAVARLQPGREVRASANHPPRSDPTDLEQAARISVTAWKDPAWGVLVWLAMVAGARRGELCALRWAHVDLDAGILTICRSVAQSGTETWEKDTKTHQRRRITLDETTVALLRAFRSHGAGELAQSGIELGDDAYLFSRKPDRSTWLRPSSVSQRYARTCKRLGWDMDIKELRHYSATELIAAGVDVRIPDRWRRGRSTRTARSGRRSAWGGSSRPATRTNARARVASVEAAACRRVT